VRAVLLSLAACLATLILAFVVFNAYFYPAHELRTYTQDQYIPAWNTAAKGFCRSAGLAYLGADTMKFRKVSTGPEAFVWGVARARTAQGQERLVWVYLEWSTKRHIWLRNNSLVLADDDDEIYYSRQFPGQFRRAATALAKAFKENARHVREVAQDWGA
jgi:hypothetical protein